MNNLITIDGQKMWGLLPGARDKRQQYQFDQDYVETLFAQTKSDNSTKAKEAKDALIWLNAYVMAELDGNFKFLETLGLEVTEAFKKDIYNSRNAAQRDLLSNNRGGIDELTEYMMTENQTLGELVEDRKAYKKQLKGQGISMRTSKEKKLSRSVEKGLPVKILSKAELAKFEEEYFKKK